MLTGFSKYDDEGTLMIVVKQYLGGAKLYDRTILPYGPVYYFYNWAVRTLSRTPVTHDMVRLSSLIPWLLTALVSAWIVLRLTDSLVLASATHFLTCLRLSAFFQSEPGHPQELCILLAVCLVASGIIAAMPNRRLLGMIMLGTLTAALLLVKVNIGVFAFLAGALALLSHSPKSRISRLAFHLVVAATLVLPIILMKSHLADEETRMYAVLVVASLTAVLLILYRRPRTTIFRFRDSWNAFGSFATIFVVIILALKATGVDLNSMLHALLLDSLSTYVTRGGWFVPLPADSAGLLWIAGALGAAVFFSGNTTDNGRREDLVCFLKLVLIIFTAEALYFRMPIYMLVLPYCWLVLFGHQDTVGEPDTFPRTLLCTFTIVVTLYAYPIAGSQMSFIQVLPVIVVMTCLGDLLRWQQKKLSVPPPVLRHAATWGILLWVAASYLAIARSERNFYESLPSLHLPGAERIHLYPAQLRDYRWLVKNLNDHCEMFVAFPELPSLHIWTGKDTLRGMDVDDWMLSASQGEQLAAVTVLSQRSNSCAIYNPDLENFWNTSHQNWDSLPLVRYLHENFKVVGTTGRFSLLVRNDRSLNIQ
jgi:hypothetical protein